MAGVHWMVRELVHSEELWTPDGALGEAADQKDYLNINPAVQIRHKNWMKLLIPNTH